MALDRSHSSIDNNLPISVDLFDGGLWTGQDWVEISTNHSIPNINWCYGNPQGALKYAFYKYQ